MHNMKQQINDQDSKATGKNNEKQQLLASNNTAMNELVIKENQQRSLIIEKDKYNADLQAKAKKNNSHQVKHGYTQDDENLKMNNTNQQPAVGGVNATPSNFNKSQLNSKVYDESPNHNQVLETKNNYKTEEAMVYTSRKNDIYDTERQHLDHNTIIIEDSKSIKNLESEHEKGNPCRKKCWIILLFLFLLTFVAIIGIIMLLLHTNKLE